MAVKSYRELLVWQKGIALVEKVYLLTTEFPEHEKFGLESQLRRAAVSIPSNIAEGQAREHSGEFRRFLYITLGSLAEVDTQLEIAVQLRYVEKDIITEITNLILELRKMLFGLINKLPL
ncbi:MAG: four helix bundle protein [Anaerolineae bacterium]|nr:four helix bundle protein [Anaerolineae bacterium]